MLTPQQITKNRKWIEALRSGKYKQTKSRLRDTFGFCCLGVACDLINSDAWHFNILEKDYSFSNTNERSVLPENIQNLYGLLFDTGISMYYINEKFHVDGHLTTLNDKGFTFTQIADVIEYWIDNNSTEVINDT